MVSDMHEKLPILRTPTKKTSILRPLRFCVHLEILPTEPRRRTGDRGKPCSGPTHCEKNKKQKHALLHSENANTVLSVFHGLNGHSGPTSRYFCSVLVHQSMDRVMVTPASPWHLATWELLANIGDLQKRLFPPSLKALPFLKRVS